MSELNPEAAMRAVEMSLFESATRPVPKDTITVEKLVDLVRNPSLAFIMKLKEARAALAAGKDDEYAAIKRSLPAASFAGVFRLRNNSGLQAHSGLIPIDIDHLDMAGISSAWDKLKQDPHCVFLYVSPSGAGLKGALRLDFAPADDAQHKRAFRAATSYLKEVHGLTLDPACKDVSRLAFLSWDDECHSNFAADPLDVEKWVRIGGESEPVAPVVPTIPAKKDTEDEFVSYHDNDAGRAARFVDRWRDDIRYVPERGVWLVWEGRWKRDINGGLTRRAITLANELMAEVASKPAKGKDDLKRQAEEIRQVQRWGNRSTIEPMLTLAQADPSIQGRVDALDADPFLLGTPNAIVDLRTGEAFPHEPGLMVTMCTLAVFDAEAKAPRWEKFIEEVFPDPEVRRYLWKAFGYSITGDMGEECFFMCHNTGRNGKSKAIGAVDYVLGDYADTAGQGLVISSDRGDDPKREKAKIVGKRFLRAPETEGRQRINVRAIKDITGGDPLDAEAKYESPFTFKPTCKLWWACNHKPDVKDIGLAIWERVRLIPFERYFKPEERDPNLEAKLQAEASGILNWLIEGCLLWQREGLKAPAKVLAAVEEYRREEDTLADFIEECTEASADEVTPHSALFRRYEEWAKAAGMRWTMTKKQLAKALREKGWQERRTTQSFTNWVGVALV